MAANVESYGIGAEWPTVVAESLTFAAESLTVVAESLTVVAERLMRHIRNKMPASELSDKDRPDNS